MAQSFQKSFFCGDAFTSYVLIFVTGKHKKPSSDSSADNRVNGAEVEPWKGGDGCKCRHFILYGC